MTKDQKDAFMRLHLAVLIAGGTGLFGRLITIGELPLVAFRVILGAAILWAVMSYRKRTNGVGDTHKIFPRRLIMQIMACGVLLSVHWVFYYGSIKAANVSIGAVCFALVGFFTAVVEPLLGRHRASWRELFLGAFSVVGIALIFGLDPRYRLGIGLGVISSVLYTLFSVACKRVQGESGVSSSTMLLYEMIGGGIVLTMATPLYARVFPDVALMPTEQNVVMLLLFASVFTIAPFLLQLQALRHISAFTVNLTYNLEPVYTILLAMLIFGEAGELNFSFYLGIAFIIASVLLQMKTSKA